MKREFYFLALIVFLSLGSLKSYSQCSICTRTVQQMGERPGKAFNAGIIYLAFHTTRYWRNIGLSLVETKQVIIPLLCTIKTF